MSLLCAECGRPQRTCVQTPVSVMCFSCVKNLYKWRGVALFSEYVVCAGKRITSFTMEIIGFSSIWQCLCHMAPCLKGYYVYSRIGVQELGQSLTERMESGSVGNVAEAKDPPKLLEANDPPKLHRVFSSSLDNSKSWFALNFSLCGCKPSRFCTLGYSQVSPEEYRQIDLDDLLTDGGVPASSIIFSESGRRSEKVYVASAFGLTVGLLRQKSLADVRFIKSNEFKALVSWVNAFGLRNHNEVHPSVDSTPQKPTAEIMAKKKGVLENENSESLPPTPPITPSPPKSKSAPSPDIPPKSGKKRTLADLRTDEDLSPASKKRKIRETAVGLMEQMKKVCDAGGESIGSIIGECCLLTKKVGRDARELFGKVMEIVAQEKGVREAFSKLIPEDVWEEKLKTMRVPDWIYLFFKLKSRISDRSWQDLINLTRLGRTGVRFCQISC